MLCLSQLKESEFLIGIIASEEQLITQYLHLVICRGVSSQQQHHLYLIPPVVSGNDLLLVRQ